MTSHHEHHSEHHVKFGVSGDSREHNADIIVECSPELPASADISLGFLQHNYIYDINFEVADTLGEDLIYDPLQSLNLRLKEYEPSADGGGHFFSFELKATKEHLMTEVFKVSSLNNSEHTLTLRIKARVLGKGKGTPSLRNGIHCTGYCPDDDTDAGSDWQGFEDK